MIRSFLHKGLQSYFESGSTAGIPAAHALKGDRAGIWSVRVTGNWRITFRFEDGDAYILNYEDYH